MFGADLPVEGATGGHFAWRDGLFLQALKLGHWIVLDEVSTLKLGLWIVPNEVSTQELGHWILLNEISMLKLGCS